MTHWKEILQNLPPVVLLGMAGDRLDTIFQAIPTTLRLITVGVLILSAYFNIVNRLDIMTNTLSQHEKQCAQTQARLDRLESKHFKE